MIAGHRVIDVHVHIQPWEMHPPDVQLAMESGRADLPRIREFMESPKAFLGFLDECGIERAALINYVAPDVMGFTYAAAAPDRLIAFGSVNPRFTNDPAGETRRVLDLGIRGLKVHPPHQLFAVNDYRTGGPGAGIGDVFRIAEERGVPVMIHTGTSVFPGARNVYADPMPADDVGVDFPKLRVILAHAGRPLHGETAHFLIRRHENFFLDLSGIPPKRLFQYVPRLAEVAGRCLWGSDWPSPGVSDVRKNVDDFLALDLPDAARRAILWDNAARLF
jgi:predicted TIM-barrel fold metal-dependent hydrolase